MGSAIGASVFPRHQGGPHKHSIMAIAVCSNCKFQELSAFGVGKYNNTGGSAAQSWVRCKRPGHAKSSIDMVREILNQGISTPDLEVIGPRHNHF